MQVSPAVGQRFTAGHLCPDESPWDMFIKILF